MFAVIQTGGKQYRAERGKKLLVEKLPGKEGEKISFSEVLLVADSKNISVGKPQVSGAVVEGKITAQTKGKKLIVFKFRPKKRYKVKTGHRQQYTEVEIMKVSGK